MTKRICQAQLETVRQRTCMRMLRFAVSYKDALKHALYLCKVAEIHELEATAHSHVEKIMSDTAKLVAYMLETSGHLDF